MKNGGQSFSTRSEEEETKTKERTADKRRWQRESTPEYLTSKKVISRLSDCSCACNLCFPYKSGSLGGDRGIGIDDADEDERAFPLTVAAAVAVEVVAAAAMVPSTQTTALTKKGNNKKKTEKKNPPSTQHGERRKNSVAGLQNTPTTTRKRKAIIRKMGEGNGKAQTFFWGRRGGPTGCYQPLRDAATLQALQKRCITSQTPFECHPF